MQSWKAWVKRPIGLIKKGQTQVHFLRKSREVGMEANIDSQSKINIVYYVSEAQ